MGCPGLVEELGDEALEEPGHRQDEPADLGVAAAVLDGGVVEYEVGEAKQVLESCVEPGRGPACEGRSGSGEGDVGEQAVDPPEAVVGRIGQVGEVEEPAGGAADA